MVKLTLQPPEGIRPYSALRITDITDNDQEAPANPQADAVATRAGTAVTGSGYLGILALEVDGVTRQLPVTAGDATATLKANYEAFGGPADSLTFEKPNDGLWRIIRNSSAPSSSLRVKGDTFVSQTSTPNVLTELGFEASGTLTVQTSGGLAVTLVDATVRTTSEGVSPWTLRPVRNNTVVDGGTASVTIPANSLAGQQFPTGSPLDGMTAIAFELLPPQQSNPAVNPLGITALTREPRVVVRYRVKNNVASPIRLGGPNPSITRLVGYSREEGPVGDRFATFTPPVNAGPNVETNVDSQSDPF